MKLSRKSDYALRAVRHLSTLPKEKLGSINSISEAERVPREFLAKILKDLTRGGVLKSFQGVTGGYRLAKPAKDVSYLNIIEIIDGPLRVSLATDGKGRGLNGDSRGDGSFEKFWKDQEKSLKTSLSRQNFGRFTLRRGRNGN
ncbi:MAG TPA: Rrf2 family transcriptional regulator [candidate division Zixibacteria bacterium]|nr:Rrf2 family transcriptional regulator [candidate division Zixibacteria bacterium]